MQSNSIETEQNRDVEKFSKLKVLAQMVETSMSRAGQVLFAERPQYVCTLKYVFHINCNVPLYASIERTPFEFGTLFSMERR